MLLKFMEKMFVVNNACENGVNGFFYSDVYQVMLYI